MLAWPMMMDQFANARLLVDDLCTAMPVSWGRLNMVLDDLCMAMPVSWGRLNVVPEVDEVASVLNMTVRNTREVG
jgi:hypothetical protein